MSNVPERKPVDPALLKTLATRANDYLLLTLIMVLGLVALCSIPALNRVEREFQIAARV